MSGVLNSKSRVIDTLITVEGRRQLSKGGLDIKYVSFTDGGTFYKADLISGSQDATQRIYLETCQLPQDNLSFQADDDGNTTTFANSSGIQLVSGQILEYSFAPISSSIITGSLQGVSSQSGDQFSDGVDELLGSSSDNLKNLRIIASKDRIFEDDGFGFGPADVTFTLTNQRPIQDPSQFVVSLDALESIFNDPRFSTFDNFKYLPPINKVSDPSIDQMDPSNVANVRLGDYPIWGRSHMFALSYGQIMHELSHFERMGYMRSLNFDPTSGNNRLIGQFFERSDATLKKLDVIDLGTFPTGNALAPEAHIFFIGRVKVDSKGTDTFLHLFTLVFE